VTITPTETEPELHDDRTAEMLIKEARDATRRRRLKVGVTVFILGVLAIAILMGTGIISVGRRTLTPSSSGGAISTGATNDPPAPRFDEPWAIAAHQQHVWIVNFASNSITELNARSGSLVRVIDARADGLMEPSDIVYGGGHLWVTNDGGDTVTELDARSGSLVRVIKAEGDEANNAASLTYSGGRVWVLNHYGDSITELNARSGSLVRVIHLHSDLDLAQNKTLQDDFGPEDVVANEKHVWISDFTGTGCEILELSVSSGSATRTIRCGSMVTGVGEFSGFLALSGEHLWMTGIDGNSLSEFNAHTGVLVRTVGEKKDNLQGTTGITVAGSHLWVSSLGGTGLVTELNAKSGSLVRVKKDKAYRLTAAEKGHSHGGAALGPLAVTNSRVWVLNQFGSALEWNSLTGSFVRVVK
jgi:outer membrane protein assembly factor BamB